MAFDRTKLQLLAVGGAMKFYSYSSADAKATIIAANYFAPASRDLNVGDRISVHAGIGGTVLHFDAVIATSVPATPAATVLTQADFA